jgi:hypothetical protein
MMTAEIRKRNKKTGLILLGIAIVFFAGVVARRWLIGG